MAIAYWLPDVPAIEASAHPFLRERRESGPWAYCPLRGGTFAFWRDWMRAATDPPPRTDAFGEPRDIGNGVLYYPPVQLPSQADLALPARGPLDQDFRCHTGAVLTICPATTSARLLDMTTGRPTGYADDYGVVAQQVDQQIEADEGRYRIDDPAVLRLICKGIAQRYRCTPELLTDLGWISTPDFDQLLLIMLGYAPDPKSSGGDGGSSPSPPPDSSQTRS